MDFFKRSLLGEILLAKYAPSVTLTEQVYLEVIKQAVVFTDGFSKKQVDYLESLRKRWQIFFPQLSAAVGLFISSCRLLQVFANDAIL